MLDNGETSPDLIETRGRAKRGQSTLNIELGLVNTTTFNSGSINAQTGGGGGSVGGTGVVTSLAGGTSPGGSACPLLSQFIYVKGLHRPIVTQVEYIDCDDYLYDHITKTYEKVICADVLEDIELWHVTDGLISASGSPSHPIIRSIDDMTGLAMSQCFPKIEVLACDRNGYFHTYLSQVETFGVGSVKKISTEGPTHRYATGLSPNAMFLAHNLKPRPGDDFEQL